MDFGTMRSKVKKGRYGTGNNAISAFYDDFHLVFKNCRLFNPEGSDVNVEGARILAYLPEAYTLACINVSKATWDNTVFETLFFQFNKENVL